MKKSTATILLGLYILIAAPVAAWLAGGLVATFAVVGGLACAILIRLPDLVELGVGPLKAKLEREVAEAAATVNQLKALGAVFGQAILAVLAGEGRWGGMGYGAKSALKEEVDAELRKLGLNDDQMRIAHRTWNQYLLFDHGFRIRQKIPNAALLISPNINALLGPNLRVASAEDWRRELSRANLLTPDIDEAIQDLEHFVRTGAIRRRELWNLGDEA